MEDAALTALKEKLSEEESVYGDLLAELDSLADNPLPYEIDPELPNLIGGLNQQWEILSQSKPTIVPGMVGWIRRLVRKLVAPELTPLEDALERQQSFNSLLVQFMNRYLEAAHRRSARISELSSCLVRFAQRIDRLADAKDRLYATLGNTRADLLLEALDKRTEVIALGLRRAQDRMDGMATSFDLARTQLAALERRLAGTRKATPAAAKAPAPLSEAEYLAFENRYRGSSEEIRERLTGYIPLFEGRSPVVELGCGRGEFLELAGQAGVKARGIDNNLEMLDECRRRGLTVEEAELTTYVRGMPEGSVGGIFAAQVIEHLPPPRLREILAHCHRALRKDGRLVLETVNPKSLLALLEFYRDLTHQNPIHPETLDFVLRACGFAEVRIQYASPVSERAKLFTLSPDDDFSRTLNENFRKLNSILFGDLDYAAVATK